jgi:probable F420-dependent oxidoreductase
LSQQCEKFLFLYSRNFRFDRSWRKPKRGLETDATKAGQIARGFLNVYLGLPNYTNNFLRLGFTEEDIKDGGGDHLIDAIVAWGDAKTIQSRVQAHQAGADHVCIQALSSHTKALPLREWRELAGALIH